MEEILILLLGLIFGSFFNVVIYRLPKGGDIVFPRSACPNCQKIIKFYDNIPVISYLILLGKCRNCQKKISIQYPVIEIFTALTFWFAYQHFGEHLIYFIFACIFLSILIILAIIDAQHMILPDELTLGGAVLFLAFSFFNPRITTLNSIISAFSSALIFAGIYFFYVKFRKKEGLGFGDVKMMLLLGAFLGIQKLIIALFLASILGILVGLFMIIFKNKNLQLALPFGTFLSIGSYISLFYGTIIFDVIRALYL